MKQITVYSIKELEEDARGKAINDYRSIIDESFWGSGDDIVDSYKSCLHVFNITLEDYSLGPYDRPFAKLDIDDDIKELRGARALAWLENNGINDLRITRDEYLKNRTDYFKYGKAFRIPYYRIGHVKPCPLTGTCYDEVFLESLLNDVKSGCDLEDAFNNLRYVCTKLLENEADSRSSEEYIIEELEAKGYLFSSEGVRL